MKKSKEKGGVGARLCKALDLSPALIPQSSLIELHGNSLLKIQGGGRILLYTESEIQIILCKRKKLCLSIKGSSLSCSSYNMGSVGIEGKINSLSFINTSQEK